MKSIIKAGGPTSTVRQPDGPRGGESAIMHSASWIVTPVWRHAQEQYNTDCYVRHDRNSTAIGYHAFFCECS